MASASLTEAQVAALGSERHIRAHFVDELKVHTLLDLAAQSRAMVFRWPRMPNVERRRFIVERDDVVKHVDQLAARPAAEVSAPLRGDFEQARTEWEAVRASLEQLTI